MYLAFAMNSARFDIPSVSALIAFEAVARVSSVSYAAEELNTTQPAISRHIRNLETAVGQTLFRRSSTGVTLTKDGEVFYASVKTSLESLHAAVRGLCLQKPNLTIACTQEISVLLLLPVSSRLKRSVNDGATLRILSCDYDMLPLVVPAGVDIIFEYAVARTDENSVRLLDEEFTLVASPTFVKRYAQMLARHPRHWSGLPRLEVAHRGQGWANWMTWFGAHECEPPPGPVEYFENYIYLLEAAANGDGIALGWNGFVNEYFRTGRLAAVRDEWLATKIGLYAVLTASGARNPGARHCLKTLASLTRELSGKVEVLKDTATSQATAEPAC